MQNGEEEVVQIEDKAGEVGSGELDKRVKDFHIIVNGEQHIVHDQTLNRKQVIAIAFPTPPSAETRFTVAYYNAHEPKEGKLRKDAIVEIKQNGTVFNVKPTVKS